MSPAPARHPARPTSKLALKCAHYVGFSAAATCALATGVGVYSDAAASSGPLGLLMATVSGLVLGGGLGVGWHYLHEMAGHATEAETEKKALATGLAVLCVGIGIGTSGAFLARTISGASALQAYQTGYVQELETSIDTVSANAADEQGLVAAVEMCGKTLHASAKGEDEAGLVSGKRNKGVVYESLNNAGDDCANMGTKLQGIADERNEQLNEAKRDLERGKRAIATYDSTQFESAAANASGKISDAAKIHLGTTASALVTGATAGDARAPINEALGQIAKVARFVAEDRRAVAVPGYKRISETQAMLEKPQMVGWSAAVLIEMLPLLMFFVLLLLWRDERDDDDGNAAAEAMPQAPVVTPALRPRPTLTAAE